MPEEDLSEFAIKVKMLFFGPLAEKLGEREIEVALMHGSSARDLIERFHFEPLLATGLRIAVDGEIVVRSTMHASVTFDHRALDGVPVAEFMRTLKSSLESAEWLAARALEA